MVRVKSVVTETLSRGEKIKLNLGAGHKRYDGMFNVDVLETYDPEILCDLDVDGLPLPDSSCQVIIADYVLEHVRDVLQTMQEIWRVCVNEAEIFVGVPYFGWAGAHKDPTHTHLFDVDSWKYWNSRDDSIPHYRFTGNFDLIKLDIATHPDLDLVPDDQRDFAMKHFINMITKLNFYLKAVK